MSNQPITKKSYMLNPKILFFITNFLSKQNLNVSGIKHLVLKKKQLTLASLPIKKQNIKAAPTDVDGFFTAYASEEKKKLKDCNIVNFTQLKKQKDNKNDGQKIKINDIKNLDFYFLKLYVLKKFLVYEKLIVSLKIIKK